MNLFQELCDRFSHDFRMPCKLWDESSKETNLIQLDIHLIRKVETVNTDRYEVKGNIHALVGLDSGYESIEKLLNAHTTQREAISHRSQNRGKFFNVMVEFTEVVEYEKRKTLFVKGFNSIEEPENNEPRTPTPSDYEDDDNKDD